MLQRNEGGEGPPSFFGITMNSAFPLIDQMRTYSWRVFSNDAISAATVAFVLLPQSIAYATLAKITPMQSLISAMFPPILYIIFGKSKQLAVGPEAVVSIVVGVTIEQLLESGFAPSQIASTLAFVVAIICIFLAVIRGGFLDSILSGYLLTGFVLGVSNLICIEQLPALMGLKDSAIQKLIKAAEAFGTANGVTIAIGVSNVAFLLGFRALKTYVNKPMFSKIPEILVLVVAMIAFSAGLNLSGNYNVAVLGIFDNKIPVPSAPNLSLDLIQKLIQPAIIVVIVGFIESQTVTKHFGLRNGYFPSSDQELVSFGVINFAASIFGGYPVFGSLPRSRILANTGGSTTLANAMAAVIVAISSQTLVPVLQYLPKPTLGSIVFVAALGLIEVEETVFLFRLGSIPEILMFLGSWGLTVGLNITSGIIFCLGLSALLIIRRIIEPTLSIMGGVQQVVGERTTFRYVEISECDDAKLHSRITILRVNGPLMFYNIGQASASIEALMKFKQVQMDQNDVLARSYSPNSGTTRLLTTQHTDREWRKYQEIEDELQNRFAGRNSMSRRSLARMSLHRNRGDNARQNENRMSMIRKVEDWTKNDTAGLNTIILDFSTSLDMDSAAAFILEHIFEAFSHQGVVIMVCGLHEWQEVLFKNCHIKEILKDNIYPDIETAMKAALRGQGN